MASRTRLTPEERRSQLLDLGVRLLSRRSLGDVSIELLAETAGISRGLLYHYFGNIAGFQQAVVQRAADELIAITAPPSGGEPYDRLLASLTAYVDYVDSHYEGYLSMVRAAKSGNEELRAIYDDARAALGGRFSAVEPGLVPDTPAARMLVDGWQSLVEEVVLGWKVAPQITREELLHLLTASFPALLTALS